MATIRAYAQRRGTWKIAVAALAATIMLLSLFGVLSPALWVLGLVVGTPFGIRAGNMRLRKLMKSRPGRRTMVDYKEDSRVVSKLLPGERAIIATPEHPIAIVASIFSIWTLVAMAIGAGIGLSGRTQATFIVGIFLGLVVRLGYRMLVWRTDLLVLTNKRLYTVAGFFSREREAIRLRNVAGISTRISVVSYVFHWFGFIEAPIGYVKASGIGTIFERFKHTPDIEEFTRQLEIAQDQAK